MTGKTAPSAQ